MSEPYVMRCQESDYPHEPHWFVRIMAGIPGAKSHTHLCPGYPRVDQ